MIARFGRAISMGLGLLAFLSIAPVARAQTAFNPYGNSGFADYREYAVPTYSNNPALPGQARLESQGLGGGSRRLSPFESYTNGLDGNSESDDTRSNSAAKTYRQYDKEYNRVYRANDTQADRDYLEKKNRREALFAKALAEKDPAKRFRMMREAEREDSARPTARPTATRSTQTAPTTRTERAPSPLGGSRASAAPSPLSSGSTAESRRSNPAPAPLARPGTPRASSGNRAPAVPGTNRSAPTSTPTPSAPNPGALPATPAPVDQPDRTTNPSTVPIPPPG